MTDNVANLGFSVDSKPLDDAKQKLADVASQADKTGKAVDDLNQKTGASFDKTKAAATGFGQAVSSVTAEVAKSGSVSQQIEAIVAKTGVSYATAAAQVKATTEAFKASAPAMTAVGAAAAGATREAGALGGAFGGGGSGGSGLIGALSGLPPLIVPITAGLGALALGASALLLGLAKVGDEVERTKNRLSGLIGSADGGAKVFDAITGASKRTGIEAATLEAALEQATIGQEKFADKNVIYANTADMAAKKATELTAAIGSFGQIMQSNLANADEEKRALNALGASFEQTGTLGVSAFQKIRAESPSTALAIANAFGSRTVKEFTDDLAKTPISLEDFVRRMAQITPQIGTPTNTVSQSVRELHQEWDRFIKTLAETGAVEVARNSLIGLTDTIKKVTSDDWLKSTSISDSVAKWVADNITDPVKNSISSGAPSINDAIDKGIIAPIKSWLNSTSIADVVSAWAQNNVIGPIAKAVQAAASMIAGIAKGGGSNISAAGGAGGTEGMGMGAFSNGQTAGILQPSGDAGTVNLGDFGGGEAVPNIVAGGDMPAFAVGGQLTVGGSGGTDTTLVQFKATPGEVVTVNTPDQMAQGSQSGGIQGLTTIQGQPAVVAATPDPAALATVKEITDAIDQSTIDISKQVAVGSDNIVKALNKLIGGVASSTVNPSTGLPVSSPSGSSATSGLSSLSGLSGSSASSGGGFTVKGLNRDYAAESAKLQKQFDAANKAAQGGDASDPMYTRAYGSSIRGSRSSGGFPTRGPTGSFSPINPNYPSGLGDQNFNSPITDYNGDSNFSGSLSDIGGGMSNLYGTDASGSGTFTGSISDIGYTDILTGASDPNANNYGGGSTDYGYFKAGGQFKVGGSGGTDSQLIKLHTTPGEIVTVTPGGMAPPDGVNMPSLSSASDASQASDPSQANVTSTMTKNVIINVQAGIQAEQFIRSRAQIARGI
jgi:hypothetical protein